MNISETVVALSLHEKQSIYHILPVYQTYIERHLHRMTDQISSLKKVYAGALSSILDVTDESYSKRSVTPSVDTPPVKSLRSSQHVLLR